MSESIFLKPLHELARRPGKSAEQPSRNQSLTQPLPSPQDDMTTIVQMGTDIVIMKPRMDRNHEVGTDRRAVRYPEGFKAFF